MVRHGSLLLAGARLASLPPAGRVNARLSTSPISTELIVVIIGNESIGVKSVNAVGR
jgi:hypothetical protein